MTTTQLETQEFLTWYQEQQQAGLVDIKFVTGDGIDIDTTREDFSAENNRVNRLIKSGNIIDRPDVF